MGTVTIYDFLSLIPLIYLAFVLIQVKDPYFRWLFILAVMLCTLIELFKLVSRPWLSSFLQLARPQGAMNCNCWNSDGDVSGQPGMPSGHVALICFLMVSIFIHGVRSQSIVAVWGIYAMVQIYLVALSRIKKKCHTELQVVAGGVIGVSCAMLYALVAPK